MNYKNKTNNMNNRYNNIREQYEEPSCYQLIQDITKSIYKITNDISDIKNYIFDYINKDTYNNKGGNNMIVEWQPLDPIQLVSG